MSNMKFSVTLFDYDDRVTSEHRYDSKKNARKKYKDCVRSAQCANVGRVKLYETVPYKVYFGGGRPWTFTVLEEWYDNDRPQPEPKFQVEGYIVHSARTLNGTTNCQRGNKTFHKDEDEAVAKAKHLAEKWSDGHEGVIVFKAVKHVYKGAFKTRIVVEDL